MPNNVTNLKQKTLSQLFSVVSEFGSFDNSVYDDFSGGQTTKEEIAQFNIRCLAVIERIVGKESVYYEQALVARNNGTITSGHLAKEMFGIVNGLYRDVQGDFIQTATELIHANLFSDFFTMGDYLLKEGYKDAAAVIVGGILETHLRQLAIKNSIDTFAHVTGKTDSPKKAETLNQEMGKSVYSLLQQKSITAWLDIRNNAAHAHYEEYDDSDVRNFSIGLKNLIDKYPA